MKSRNTGLPALKVAVLCVTLSPFSIQARADEPNPPDVAKGQQARFRTSLDAVNAFLSAARARDATRLREATSPRAPIEASPRNRGNRALFTAILEQKLTEAELEELAVRFDGFQVVDISPPTSTGRIRYILGKPGPNGLQFVRTITARHHKEQGWKICDFSEAEIRARPIPIPWKPSQ